MTEQIITAPIDPEIQSLSETWVNLASRRLGSETLLASDDFFAPKERLIDLADPIFIPDKYDDHGKWMDGWESRRRRSPGHDWCIIKFGYSGRISFVDIDTSFFTGNYAPKASIDVCSSNKEIPDEADWQSLVPLTDLKGDSHNVIEVSNSGIWSHLRLNIVPDGGVARLRVFGELEKNWSETELTETVDLAALANGARPVCWSDAHYGKPSNILAPMPGIDMGDGWETARRRGPGHDWCVIKLAAVGNIQEILVDTAHFKGNYPDTCSLQGTQLNQDLERSELIKQSEAWPTILPQQKLAADCQQNFRDQIQNHDSINFIRFSIYPDGGISRLRLFGKITEID